MRVMIKFTFPIDTGNDAIRSGKVEKVFKQIAQELKPEAAYFFPQGGERGGLIVVDMTASSQVVEIAERFFFGLNAKVEMMPVMALEDLEQGLSSIEGIVQRYGWGAKEEGSGADHLDGTFWQRHANSLAPVVETRALPGSDSEREVRSPPLAGSRRVRLFGQTVAERRRDSLANVQAVMEARI